MTNLPYEIKALKKIKERLDLLMSERGTPVEIRSNALYDSVVRDGELRTLFPNQKTFNQFLRQQHDRGILKQIIPNYRVDTSDYRFYQWYFHKESSKSSEKGKEVITIRSKLKYHKHRLSNLSSNELKLRSEQEREIYERLLTCDYLTIEYEFPVSKYGETKYVDFKISNRINQKIFFWEHFGMTHSSQYLDSMTEKIKWYKENGFRPVEEGGNLIYTIYTNLHDFHKDIDRYINLIKH
ncbi:MAG: hypothetical protein M5Z89_20120 [Olivibacter sp.]|nr:hypothetical protein [Olivibacter sp. UJ_SKK_5.1]